VAHEETGLLVNARAPEQIAAAVIRLHREPESAAHATQRVRERFSRQACAKSFSALSHSLKRARLANER